MAQEYGNQSKSFLSILQRLGLNSFKSFGYESIAVDSSIKRLTIPTGAKYAVLVLESDGTGFVARCLQNTNTSIDSATGMPIANGFVGDITDAQNLVGFCITEITSNSTVLNVEYFK